MSDLTPQQLKDESRRAARAVDSMRRAAHADPAQLPSLINALKRLARLRSDQGEHHRAASLYLEALNHVTECEDQLGRGEVAALAANLAYHYDRAETWDPAAKYYRRALEAIGSADPDPPELAAVIHNNLAMILRRQGSYESAEAYYKLALKEFIGLNGERHHTVASVYNNYGACCYAARDLKRAREFHEKALDIRSALYPNGHPDVAQSCQNLAAVFDTLNQPDKAADLRRQGESMAGTGKRTKATDATGLLRGS
ncbi:MAG: tetratricopeptide repeat protein [Verrucomicrobiales bacterium]